jgi:hypothetical protein
MTSAATLDRRSLLGTLAASALLTGARPAAAEPGLADGAAMRNAAAAWLALLDADATAQARFAYDDPLRQRWNFMGPSAKPGFRLEQMDDVQREAAWALIGTALGETGLDKARNVMLLQDVLRDLGDPPASRNSQRFSLVVFGEPAASGRWGWRLEGHHLSLSFSLAEDRVVGVTPSSFSSNPNTVPSGPYRGLVTLDDELGLARRLFADLSPAQARRALLDERAYRNVQALAGREARFTQPEGLPAAELTAAQQELLWRLVEAYAVSHLAPALAQAQRERIREGDRDSVHFAWAGPNRDGEALYYRLHGPRFVIELASVDPRALHLHTVCHDLERHLGGA